MSSPSFSSSSANVSVGGRLVQGMADYKEWIGLALMFLIIGGASLWWWRTEGVGRPTFYANRERMPASNSPSGGEADRAVVMMFTADWCPYCKSAKPEWDAFKEEVSNTNPINGVMVEVVEVNCTESTAEVQAMCDKYAIEGFPTVKLDKGGGDVVSYDAKPTRALLMNFLHTML